jgi:hypothetical protein
MSNFMMNVLSWILLLLVILTLYLIDKVNYLSKLSEQPEQEQPMEDMAAGDILFAGLESKRLWDAMNGREIIGFDAKLVDALRGHYAQILHDHIVQTFEDGVAHARQKFDMSSPSADRTITTPRGHVTSWLPAQHLGSIYRAAYELGEMPYEAFEDEQIDRLCKTLDSVSSMLHQRTGVPLGRPYSQALFEKVKNTSDKMPEPVIEATDAASAQNQELALEQEHAAMHQVQSDSQTESAQPSEPLAIANEPSPVLQPELTQAYEEQQRQDIAADEEARAMTAVVIEPQPQPNPV